MGVAACFLRGLTGVLPVTDCIVRYCWIIVISLMMIQPASASGTIPTSPIDYNCELWRRVVEGVYTKVSTFAGDSFAEACTAACASIGSTPSGNQYSYCDDRWQYTMVHRATGGFCPSNSTRSSDWKICTCNTGYVPDSAAKACVSDVLIVSLQSDPPAQVEPSQSVSIAAKVINALTGQPKDGVRVNLKVDVEVGTGGHDHDDGQRPKGSVLVGGITGADGVLEFTFGAPQVAGRHTITATCDRCNNTATVSVDVKVEGLVQIPGSPYYLFIGATNEHSDNHYLTPEAEAVLKSMAVAYQFESRFKIGGVAPLPLHLNDASLVWGGVFDLDASWDTPHEEHMRGTVIDIRANSLAGAIAPENFDSFIKLAQDRGVDVGKAPHAFGLPNQHFHVRLLNRKE